MSKRVLSVGQCSADTYTLKHFLEREFDASLVTAHDLAGALSVLSEAPCDLVLVNRQLDRDGSDGLSVLRSLKEDQRSAGIPSMLVTNYPEFQQAAVAAGAEPGFGKSEYGRPETRARLARFLE